MPTIRNSVTLIGRLGVDPEITKYKDERTKVRFSFATTEYYKDKDGNRVEETQWHNIVAWGGTANYINKYCQKGNEIAIAGKLTHRTYEKDGQTRYITEVVANEVAMFSKKE